jgi:hypothetical protein
MTRDPTTRSSVPDLTLERYRLGELPPKQMSAIGARAKGDALLQARLAALDESDDAIRGEREAGWLARAVAERMGRSGRAIERKQRDGVGWTGSNVIAFASAAVIVVAAGLWSASGYGRPGAVPATVAITNGSRAADRIKGTTAVLLVYRKIGPSSEQLRDGDAARQGDLVRVAYRASNAGFGVIVSIDGRGVVTRHLPVAGDAAVALQAGDATPLANAYELDDAPRWEQFFLVTNDHVFDVARVVDAARRAWADASPVKPPGALPLPAGFTQSSFLLRKVF